MPEKPRTQREMLEQLWYAVIGTNNNGVQGRVERIEERLPRLVTREELREVEVMIVRRKRLRWAILGVLVAAVPAYAVVSVTLARWLAGG